MIGIIGIKGGMFVTIGKYKVLAQHLSLKTNNLDIIATMKAEEMEEFPGDCVAQCPSNFFQDSMYVPRELDYSWRK